MNDSFLEFIKDQFSVLGAITIRKMFGGAGIYLEGTMFGLIADDLVYLKVDTTNKKDYENAKMAPFTYEGKNKTVKMSYYELPIDILEDQEQLKEWASKAVSVSLKKSRK